MSVYFHVASEDRHASIMELGLRGHDFDSPWSELDHPRGNYLFGNRADAETYGRNLYGLEEYLLYQVIISDDDVWPDPEQVKNEEDLEEWDSADEDRWYTEKAIPPEALALVMGTPVRELDFLALTC